MKTTRTRRGAGKSKQAKAVGKGTGRELVPLGRFDGEPIPPPATIRIPLLPLRNEVVFPQTVIPLIVNRAAGIRLIDDAMLGDKTIGLVTQVQPDVDEPGLEDLHPVLCIGTILKMLRFPDGSTRVVCQGLQRARLLGIARGESFPVAEVEPLEEVIEPGSNSMPWPTTSTSFSRGWSTRAARCPKSCKSRR
ncbi:MAG: LON peptidase substrate-binding domain-containing protein [Isosphaeraceae bacterium]